MSRIPLYIHVNTLLINLLQAENKTLHSGFAPKSSQNTCHEFQPCLYYNCKTINIIVKMNIERVPRRNGTAL